MDIALSEIVHFENPRDYKVHLATCHLERKCTATGGISQGPQRMAGLYRWRWKLPKHAPWAFNSNKHSLFQCNLRELNAARSNQANGTEFIQERLSLKLQTLILIMLCRLHMLTDMGLTLRQRHSVESLLMILIILLLWMIQPINLNLTKRRMNGCHL